MVLCRGDPPGLCRGEFGGGCREGHEDRYQGCSPLHNRPAVVRLWEMMAFHRFLRYLFA